MIRDGMLIKKNCINYEVFIHHSFIESSGGYSSTLKHIEAYSELLRFCSTRVRRKFAEY